MPDNTNQEFGSVGIVGTNTAPSMDNIDKKLDEIIVELKEINKNITNNKVAEVTPIIEPETVTPDFSSEEKLTSEEPVKEAEDNMTTGDLTDEINRAIEKIRKEKEMEETNEPSFSPVDVAKMPEAPTKDKDVIDISEILSEASATEQTNTPVMESTNQPVVNETPVVEPVKNDPIIIPETVPADTPIVPTAPVEAPVVAPASAPIEVPTVAPASAPIEVPAVAPATAPIEPANEVTDKTIELKPDVLVNDNNVVAPAQEVPTNDVKKTVVTSMYPSSFTVKVGDGAQRFTADFDNEKLAQKQVEKTLVMNNAA